MKNKKLLPLLLIIIFSGGGAAIGFFASKAMLASGNTVPREVVISMLLLFIPAFFLVIAFHEAGHALAGVRVNFDFRMYVVGPFMWEKQANGWSFKWNKNVNVAGGLVVCLPAGENNISKRFALYAAAGPLASLVLTALAYALYRLTNPPHVNHSTGLQVLAFFFLMVAILSLFIFLATSIPLQTGGFASDGARVLRLLRGGDSARFETLMVKIVAGTTGGTRPAALEINELEEAQTLAKKLNAPFGVYLHSYLHQRAFDKNELEKAEYHLQHYISEASQIPDGIRDVVWLDAAFFYAFAKQDLETAIQYWNKFKPGALIPKAQIYATQAAISTLKKEKEIAVNKKEAALKELPNMIDKGMAVALKEKLSLLAIND